jgi:CRISPR system Cascade subunit CasD
MVAAALGLDRADQAAHDALDTGYGVAVRLDSPGIPMVDYHTAQTVSASAVKKHHPATRAEALLLEEPQTILSRRTYREDALVTLCIWRRDDARWTLEGLAAALRSPMFTLYAGRKANVLGLPVGPRLVKASTLSEAFNQVSAIPGELHEFSRFPVRGAVKNVVEIAHDPCIGFDSGLNSLRHEIRRDAAAHRVRWQFAERMVEIGTVGGTS